MLDKIKESAKSIGTLLTGVITALIAAGVDGDAARYLALAAAVIGAVVVWSTPNKETDQQQRVRLAGEEALREDDGLTYEQAGGNDFPTSPDDQHSGTPETTQLYESGEAPGFDVGEASVTQLPVSGNDNDTRYPA